MNKQKIELKFVKRAGFTDKLIDKMHGDIIQLTKFEGKVVTARSQ